MSKCVFLSTSDEYVQCSRDCGLYNWEENDNKCPFTELTGKGKKVKNLYDFELYKEEDYKEDKYLNFTLGFKDSYL